MTPESIREKALQAGINKYDDYGSDIANERVELAIKAALDVYTEQCGFAMGQGAQEKDDNAITLRDHYVIAASNFLSHRSWEYPNLDDTKLLKLWARMSFVLADMMLAARKGEQAQ